MNRTLHHARGVCFMTLLMISLILAACGGAQGRKGLLLHRLRRRKGLLLHRLMLSCTPTAIRRSRSAGRRAGATSYRIYRGTKPGGEGNTPIAATVPRPIKDSNLSSTPIYFYQLTAVNAAGESARTDEDASKTPPPSVPVATCRRQLAGNSLIFYCKDALLGGFDWFQRLNGWFPQVLGSSGAISPGNASWTWPTRPKVR